MDCNILKIWNLNAHSGVIGAFKDAELPTMLKPREYEVFTVVPLKQLTNGPSFAPIGLIEMFNSGGTVAEVMYSDDADVEVKVRSAGTVGAYSSARPKGMAVDSEAVGFTYDDVSGLAMFEVGVPEQELYSWTVSIEY